MKPTAIKLDAATLPKDGQCVRWQCVGEEMHPHWHQGRYCADEHLFNVGFSDQVSTWHSAYDVLHWSTIDNPLQIVS